MHTTDQQPLLRLTTARMRDLYADNVVPSEMLKSPYVYILWVWMPACIFEYDGASIELEVALADESFCLSLRDSPQSLFGEFSSSNEEEDEEEEDEFGLPVSASEKARRATRDPVLGRNEVYMLSLVQKLNGRLPNLTTYLLLCAIQQRQLSVMDYLLSKQAPSLQTMREVFFGPEVARHAMLLLLLRHGANPTQLLVLGCAFGASISILEFLLEHHDANPNVPCFILEDPVGDDDTNKETALEALQLSSSNNTKEKLELLQSYSQNFFSDK